MSFFKKLKTKNLWLTEVKNPPIVGEEKGGVENLLEHTKCQEVESNSNPKIGKEVADFWEQIILDQYR